MTPARGMPGGGGAFVSWYSHKKQMISRPGVSILRSIES